MKRTLIWSAASSLALGSLLVAGVAFAQGMPQGPGWGDKGETPPGVFGSVSAISGDTLTVTSKGFGQHATTTTYMVDATNATVTKNGSASSVSAIAVGDSVMVQGTVSGTNVIAKTIRDGIPQLKGRDSDNDWSGHATSTMPHKPMPMGPTIAGNGEPVVGGTISAINNSTITLTNKSNVTYTVDASSALVSKGNATSSVSSLAVGDNVLVQGTVNGTSITASTIIDQGAPKTAGNDGKPGFMGIGNIFGGLGAFFHHLFGFF